MTAAALDAGHGTVLITGAGGFVGLNLAERLLRDGRSVVGFSRNQIDPAALSSFARLPGRFAHVSGDVRDAAALDAAVEAHGVADIVHMATITAAADRERSAAADVLAVNLCGTANAIAAAAAHGARLLFTSSIAVYGPDTPDGGISDEDTPHDPRTLYAITKSAGEAIVRRLGGLHGIEWAIVRLGRLFGPWEHDTGVRDTMSQVYQVTMAARHGTPIAFARPCVKNWSYAPDTAADMAVLLGQLDWRDRIYNLGAPHAWSLEAWCRRLAGLSVGLDYRVGDSDADRTTIDLWGDRDGALLSWAAFERDFGRPPAHDLDAAFAAYMAFIDATGWRTAA